MQMRMARPLGLLVGLLMVAVMVQAGGIDPRDMPAEEPIVRGKVTATPEQTSIAVDKARQAVVPAVEKKPASQPAPVMKKPQSSPVKALPPTRKDSWLFASREGKCAPLTNVSREVKNIGTFKTPQEFARQMQQRGYQAFALDIGDVRDQVMRVKVPDLDLDLLFMRPEMCR